jgi:hypothetical protein
MTPHERPEGHEERRTKRFYCLNGCVTEVPVDEARQPFCMAHGLVMGIEDRGRRKQGERRTHDGDQRDRNEWQHEGSGMDERTTPNRRTSTGEE